jgi:homocitrate synthase NifV
MAALIDSTLREGEQTPGVYLRLDQKVAIVSGLARIGIEEIELGHAVGDGDMPVLLAEARRLAPGARLALWCRALAPDIAAGGALAPDVLAMSLPVSDLHLERRLGRSRQWLLDHIGIAAGLARSSGVGYVSLGLEDATRADPDLLDAVCARAAAAGLDRLRLADTVGIATPASLTALLARCRRHFGGAIGVHTHNDFGMAGANAIAAMEAGADWADVTVLGLGERAGNARLEEVVGWLVLAGGETCYDTRAVVDLCRRVAPWAGRRIEAHHPLLGSRLFTCESGLHVDGLAKDARTYEPYAPVAVGAERHVWVGKHAGRGAVRRRLAELGVELSAAAATDVATRVRRKARAAGRPLSDAELIGMARSAIAPASSP